MTNRRGLKLHVELDVEVEDTEGLKSYARERASEQIDDAEDLSEVLLEIEAGPAEALQAILEPERLVEGIPGVRDTSALWRVQEADEDEATAADRPELGADDSTDDDAAAVDEILASAERVRGLDLERLGYDPEEADPDEKARSLRSARAVAGSISRSYETLVDELFQDIETLSADPASASASMRISDLPPLYRSQYGPLFAQRFLAVTIELGTDMSRGFISPNCVAQELALRLVLDGVEVLAELYPDLRIPDGWRGQVEDSLFEDLDHELLYDPSKDGISDDPDYADLGIADLDFSAWFDPFTGRTVNPYARD